MAYKIVDKLEYETKILKENKELIKDFLQEKKANGKRPKTIYQYGKDAEIILTLIYRHFNNKSLLDMTRKDIRSLSLIFKDMDMSNARVNRLMSTLRSALEYFVEDDELEYDNNIGKKVKGLPKQPVREIIFLEDDWIYKLKDELVERGEILIALYLMLSYISAARKNEVIQVLKQGLSEKFSTNVVIGKRAKPFKLYYNQEVQDLIKEYIKLRGEDDVPELLVHLFKTGKKKVEYGTITSWCEYMSKVLSEILGEAVKFNAHALRHSRLEALSSGKNKDNQKYDLGLLQVLANHSDPGTTKSYLQNHDEEAIAQIFGMTPEQLK